MKYLDKRGLIKTIYCLMVVNGSITEEEIVKFDEIGLEIDHDLFQQYRDDFIRDCNENLNLSEDGVVSYDSVQTYVDRLFEESISSGRLSSRFIVWNMFAIAYSDNSIDKTEIRLIKHVARMMEMKKSVFAELEQYMKTAIDLSNELELLTNSGKPYDEIRPMVDEVEKRQKVIMRAVTGLINDEVYEFHVSAREDSQPKGKNKTIQKIGEATSNAAANVKATINDSIAPAAKEAGSKIAGGVQTAAKKIETTSSSLYKKATSKDNKEEQ